MICGGTEAAVVPIGIAGFSSMRAISTRNDAPQSASRPFDKDRDGFVMAEGSGVLVLESLESALARGAEIIAEFIGYGASADANHITSPASDGNGASRAIQVAMDHANIGPNDVNYINAHGTSTQLGDDIELKAIMKIIKDNKNIKVSSTKSISNS
jgi:3-oxoacyl-[acyl-carrier-protein] synthase II